MAFISSWVNEYSTKRRLTTQKVVVDLGSSTENTREKAQMETQPTAELQKIDRTTLRGLIQSPEYVAAFQRVLKDRTPQFISSVLSIAQTMRDVEPKSIIGAAMTAATLDLPVDKNLGFAWIVPFRDKGVKRAQFQLGARGYVQLALRTGTYAGINARAINREAFKGWNRIGEPEIDWALIDDTKPVFGYVVGWTMVNGFTKLAMWTKERVIEHAKRYSQSYRGGYDSPWKSHFDAMALKTVVKNELSDWGLMSIETKASVQLQRAIVEDQTIRDDLDAEPRYPDNAPAEQPVPQIGAGEGQSSVSPADEAAQAASGLAPEQPTTPRRGRPVGSKNKPKVLEATPAPPAPELKGAAEPTPPNQEPAGTPEQPPTAPVQDDETQASPQGLVADFANQNGVTWEDFRDWCATTHRLDDAMGYQGFEGLPSDWCKALLADASALKRVAQIFGKRE